MIEPRIWTTTFGVHFYIYHLIFLDYWSKLSLYVSQVPEK